MSNKKSPRSKKTDGGNVPNFVFNLSGSQPGSPLASPGGFGTGSTPGSPAQTSFNLGANISQPFTFGDPASRTSTTNSAFNFNTNTPNSASFNIKRGQSELDLSGPERNPIRRATSDLTFNAPSSSTQPFTFSANTVTSGLTSQRSFGSVGSQTSTTSFSAPAATSGISFGTPATATIGSNTTTNTPATTTSTGFSFSAPTTASTTASTTTAAPTTTISFGAPASTTSKPATSTSVFTFGSPALTTPSTTAAASSSSTSSIDTAKPAAPTSFSGFSFGSSSAVVTPTPTSTGLSFGKPAENTKPATTTSSFSIPATTTTTTPTTSSVTTSAADKPATTTSPFTFSVPKPSTTAASSTSPFTFGSSAATTSTATSTTTSATSAPTSSLFSLGTVATDKDGKKDSVVTSTPFSFGSGITTSSAPSIPAVDPNKPNPFSFSKILEDLAKVEAQPPNQMYASLIKPTLSVLQPNQIVYHTSFRIDNILPSTRFSELPEQAQKELDELEKHIRLESQRCEYIGNQTGPKHLEAMEKSKKNTETLTQQLDAFTCTLKAQKESIESFYENVKTQLRHASEGCAVIEACKHPGDNARWLFGHSDDDDYFSVLANHLEKRLEEYKKCIWEVERTAESWTHNRMQSPQDIANIMRAQNQAFLALSNKVAALHESVNAEKDYYSQYLRMRS